MGNAISDKLLKNTLIYSIGSFGSKILSFLLLPLFSLYLSTVEMGQYDLILTFTMLVTPVITLQLSDAIYRWLISDDKEADSEAKVISSALMMFLIASVIILVIAVVVSHFYPQPYLTETLVLLLVSSLFYILQQALRGLGLTQQFAWSGILYSFLLLVLSVGALWLFADKLFAVLAGMILANLLVILIILFRWQLYRYLSWAAIDRQLLKPMLSYSLPLVPNAVSWWLMTMANKYIIFHQINTAANGIYAVSSRLPSILMIVFSLFLLAWQDVILKNESADYREVTTETFNQLAKFMFSIGLIFISVSEPLIHYLFAKQFYVAWQYMPLLVLATIFTSFCAFLGTAYQQKKNTLKILTTTLLGAVINIVISFFLMAKIGLFAAALGTLVSFIIVFLIRQQDVKAFYPVHLGITSFWLPLAMSFIYCYVVSLNQLSLNLVLFAIAVVMFFIWNQRLVSKIWYKFKERVL
ncbi:oligosaccharide flippase family protein [Gallibacterium salpingitidis]|uniref:Polysaccharide biosynthesis protein n=1 Tax=Gallibacterium salpingitidis TaxID=505341 RepID=A0A1A7NXH3_9PAST|nr:oligosaccharide flippase family protein [Gallibacterium salpingitidis]OBW94398.1 polysaccharide biosynthesis protein [Gallibacterium salpingitidis]